MTAPRHRVKSGSHVWLRERKSSFKNESVGRMRARSQKRITVRAALPQTMMPPNRGVPDSVSL